MNVRRPSAIVLLMVLCLASLVLACASPSLPSAGPGDEVGRGNALYDRQNYAAALEAYTEAAAQLPESPEVAFNQGVAHYALGDYGEAERLFRQVDRTARNPELVAAARYNLGNSKFQQGIAQRESDVQQALSALQASVAFYQGALELTPQDREAARNIEVVRLIIKDILDQLQEQQQEQQAESEVVEQLRDLQQRQEDAAAQSAQLAAEPPPDTALSEALRQLRQEQQQITTETAAAAQRLNEQRLNEQAASAQPSGTPAPSGTPGPSETPTAGDERRQEALQKLQDAQSQQERAADRLEGQQPRSAATHQRAAAEDIAAALRALRDPNDAGTAGAPQEQPQQKADAQQASGQPQQQESNPQEQDEQRRDATAAQILAKERRDRAAREQLQRELQRVQPVEKDW